MLPFAAWADTVKGPEIATALTARVVQYEDGATQNFFADGRTLYENGGSSWGRWRVEGDHYCSQWPPSAHWACYSLRVEGLTLEFQAADGSLTLGKYVDLN